MSKNVLVPLLYVRIFVYLHRIYVSKNVVWIWKELYYSNFLIQRNARLLPIEVKAKGNVRANSLSRLLGENKELTAIRYSMLPYKEQGQLTNVPLYAVW